MIGLVTVWLKDVHHSSSQEIPMASPRLTGIEGDDAPLIYQKNVDNVAGVIVYHGCIGGEKLFVTLKTFYDSKILLSMEPL